MPRDAIRSIAYEYAVYREPSELIAMPDKFPSWLPKYTTLVYIATAKVRWVPYLG